MNEVLAKRANIRLMDNPKQSNHTEEVVAQRYRMVKSPGEEMGYTGTEWWVQGRDT